MVVVVVVMQRLVMMVVMLLLQVMELVVVGRGWHRSGGRPRGVAVIGGRGHVEDATEVLQGGGGGGALACRGSQADDVVTCRTRVFRRVDPTQSAPLVVLLYAAQRAHHPRGCDESGTTIRISLTNPDCSLLLIYSLTTAARASGRLKNPRARISGAAGAGRSDRLGTNGISERGV